MVKPSPADAHDAGGFGCAMVKPSPAIWSCQQLQLMLMMLGLRGAMVKPNPADAHDAGG